MLKRVLPALIAGAAWLACPAAQAQSASDCEGTAARAERKWESSPLLERCAEAGHAASQALLGMIYWGASTEEVCKDKVCTTGDPKSVKLDPSLTVRDMEKRGRHWLEAGAKNGNATAQNELGHAYLAGEYGMPTDPVAARPLLEKATDGGDDIAPFNLAQIYLQGLGVPASQETGERLLRMSVQRGYRAARCTLEVILDRKNLLGASMEAMQMRAADTLKGLKCSDDDIMPGVN